jgi:MerR family transcriptional regulator, light-induced transcriptional regulator
VSGADATLHEVADLLGVHYMTAYRYVRLGVIPAEKVGGTWRVVHSDLDRFRAAPVASSDGGRRRAPWAGRLELRLLAGDARGAWGVVEAALAAGTELDEIYLDVLAPAMRSIGVKWAAGEIDILLEHRASGIAMRIVGRLGPRFARRGRSRGAVVIGSPAGEQHSLPVALVADLVRQSGWEVSDLGADVPTPSFVSALRQIADVVAVGIGVTTADHLDAAIEAIEAVRSIDRQDVLIVVGGLAVKDRDHARSLGAHAYAADGRAFVVLLDEWSLSDGSVVGREQLVDVSGEAPPSP